MKDIFEPLDDYEKELIELLEGDDYEIAEPTPEFCKKIKEIARNTGKKDQRMNIRMSASDMKKLKAMALEEGLPYQTFVSSILHKYVTGRIKLVDVQRHEAIY